MQKEGLKRLLCPVPSFQSGPIPIRVPPPFKKGKLMVLPPLTTSSAIIQLVFISLFQ